MNKRWRKHYFTMWLTRSSMSFIEESKPSFASICALTATHWLSSLNFEWHTIGVGSKLIQQMGYTGDGLGKQGQGILPRNEPKMSPVIATTSL